MAQTNSIHLLVDLYGSSAEVLNDALLIEGVAGEVVERVQAQVLNMHSQSMHPQGVIVVVALSQSHLTIHTWPEAGYAAVDLFFCSGETERVSSISELLCDRLGADRFEEWKLNRGSGEPGASTISSRRGGKGNGK